MILLLLEGLVEQNMKHICGAEVIILSTLLVTHHQLIDQKSGQRLIYDCMFEARNARVDIQAPAGSCFSDELNKGLGKVFFC